MAAETRAPGIVPDGCALCRFDDGSGPFVLGAGDPGARLVFVGEAHGEPEDERPFTGPAGQLLTRMIEAMGLTREQVFVANVVKRDPAEPGVSALIKPEIIVALGEAAARSLAATGVRVVPTFHPSELLRSPASKREAWEDLKKVAALLGLQIPPPQGNSVKRGGQ